MSWLTRMRVDGCLREKHMRMATSGERPAFLDECYTSHRALDRESKRLETLGYRVKSRRDTREAAGYRVTFVYVGETNQDARLPIGTGKNDRS